MIIGVVKEIKDKEKRVSVTPEGVKALTAAGHLVRVQHNAGSGSGFSDAQYKAAGADMTECASTCWEADLVVKVKEPLKTEYDFLQGQIIFTFFHLAGVDPQLTEKLMQSHSIAIAYETLEDDQGRLPILAPMSAVAGNMAALMGSYYLASFNEGKGMQLGTVLGKPYGKVLVIGDGIVGQHAAKVAYSMGAFVCIAGLDLMRGEQLIQNQLPGARFVLSSPETIAVEIQDADLVIGAVLSRGEKAPYVISEAMIKTMQPGSVVVDVSIDQGGCIETSMPTSHTEPVFIKHGIIHYCVTNMPGAYPQTSTLALTDATLPYLMMLVNKGVSGFIEDPNLSKAINVFSGRVTYQPVAMALNLQHKYQALETINSE